MEYEWEKEARKVFEEDDIFFDEKFRLIGVAIANDDTGEAALLRFDNDDGSVITADLWQDVSGDADRHYDNTIDAMRAKYNEIQAKGR